MPTQNNSKKYAIAVAMVAVLLLGGCLLMNAGLQPVSADVTTRYFRVSRGETLASALERSASKGHIRSAFWAKIYSSIRRDKQKLISGTYEVRNNMSTGEFVDVLVRGKVIMTAVLVREGLWTIRIGDVLAENKIIKADDFIRAAEKPEDYRELAGFPLPADSLEGYLFPDTYHLAPLLEASDIIKQMLDAFRRKVWEPLGKPDGPKLHKWVIIASMVELEAAKENERARIAGVIRNRLARNMPLQIDATINYGMGEWRPISRAEYKFDSPYNTYLHRGLPPGPICSPGFKSILAAAKSEQHDFLYYVAMPDRSHLFAITYEEHLRNIQTSKLAFTNQR